MKTLGGLYAMMESRVSTYGKLCKLQGRLDLMLSQVWLQLSSSSSYAKAHTIRISWINNVNTYLLLRTKCWLREGVGGQFLRNLN